MKFEIKKLEWEILHSVHNNEIVYVLEAQAKTPFGTYVIKFDDSINRYYWYFLYPMQFLTEDIQEVDGGNTGFQNVKFAVHFDWELKIKLCLIEKQKK